MASDQDSRSGEAAGAARASAVERLRRLEEELIRAQEALATAGAAEVPGLHLVLEAAGRRGLLPATRVQEVVRLVALDPLPAAPPAVLGTFVCRGAVTVAVSLAAVLGAPREPELDAQIAVLAGAPAVGIVVDVIHGLVDGPALHAGGGEAPGWEGSGLVAGLCLHGGEVLPLLDPGPIEALARGGRA
jgi:purine-binding chemotaxis protein CheW